MTTTGEAATVNLLLVEDDPGDVLMTREALASGGVPHNLQVVDNGESAVDFLRRRGEYRDAARPDLVFLDLNLPRLDGYEVLSIVKGDEDLRRIPVVVLTTSEAEEDVRRSYDLHANAYVTKPTDLDGFLQAVRRIDQFFLSVAKLPR
jgi:CheY-like chemotaxis protein